MNRTLLMLAILATLAGCDTLGPVRTGSVITGSVVKFVEPAVVSSYQTASEVDLRVVDDALKTLKPAAIAQQDAVNGLNQVDVRFVDGTRSWAARAAQELRLALPADAVKARRAELVKALEAFARYTATRPDAAATHLFVAAPLQADRIWLAAQLRRVSSAPVDEHVQSYTAVGWNAPTLAKDRSINEGRSS